jgi:UDP-glucose 4-epimerase
MTTLVTGATGFIGRRLMQNEYRALARRPAGFAHEAIGDLQDSSSLEKACRGIDTIFHCAGHAHAFSASNPQIHTDVNLQGTKNLLEMAGRCGVTRFIFLSSVKAMAEPGNQCVDENWPGQPISPYGRAKRAAEELVLEAGIKFGMHVVNLRLAMVYGRSGRGNLERLARGLQAGWFPRLPETGNRRSLVHVNDVVDAIRLVADRPQANGRTYIIADARPYSGKELCEAILSVSSEPRLSWHAPAWALRLGGKAGDMAGKVLGRPLPLNSEVMSRLLDSECYSPARIEQELGWRAQVGLMDGLREMLTPAKEWQ